MSDGTRRRASAVLGLTGAGRPGGRRAAAVDLVVALAALTVTVLPCRALGLGSWPGILVGGCVAAVSTRLGLGARLVRRGRR
ncbi:hypothetical protein [Streptomyces sp. SID161]|uniref:hypothetical protein n=1 Tax=Streptomyces sp. SID161 TaxID=2690251 RepID=UPI00136C8952|nr:hypothetical protein [Streptomyces sp. SID161]MYW44788.1 hypothetical protein [Streptomyces sp. SID161]